MDYCGSLNLSVLTSILGAHPEGVEIYCGGVPHAVFVTHYSGGVFYCLNPDPGTTGGYIPLEASLLGKLLGSQENILANVTQYWYVSSASIVN